MQHQLANWLVGLSLGQKRFIQLCTDTVLIALSLVVAMLLYHESLRFLVEVTFWWMLVVVIPVSLVCFVKLGFYRAVVRYITSRAYKTIIAGVLFSTLLLGLVSGISETRVSPSVLVIYALLALVSIGGLRIFMRRMLVGAQQRPKTRVIIYGAGTAGRQLQLSLQTGPDYMPVAFVDDDNRLQGRTISGCPVHAPQNLPRLIDNYGAKSLLLAMPSISRTARAKVLRRLDQLPIHVQTIPGMTDIVSGRTKISDITEVSVDDLLGRDPVPPRRGLMNRNVRGKVVMVTGAGGTIGSELCRQILEYGPKRIVLFELSEFNLYSIDRELQALTRARYPSVEITPVIGSVQNPGRVAAILRSQGVESIYHAAAYKHVPLVESNVVEGIHNNIFGTEVLAEAAVEAGVRAFILVSTDKAVRPANIMGASKRLAELVCQDIAARQHNTRFSIVRFGNVLDSSGSVIPLFRQQIAAGGPITVTHPKITRYFMTISEASQLVIQAGAMAKGGDVFVLDMGAPVQIVDLAIRMAKLSGLSPVVVPPGEKPSPSVDQSDIEICFTGLRPGEKLYEELLIGDEPTQTEHPRIMTETDISQPPDNLAGLLAQLKQLCKNHDVVAIRTLLAENLPMEVKPMQVSEDKNNAAKSTPSRRVQVGALSIKQESA